MSITKTPICKANKEVLLKNSKKERTESIGRKKIRGN
jgi:hypothetical protein